MMVPKKSLILAGAALALFGAATSAQSQSGKVFARYNKPLKSATLDLSTGTVTRGPVVSNRVGTTVTDFDNNDLGGFVGVDTGNGFCKWIDAGVKGTGAGRTAGVVNNSDLMNSIVFAYCSAKLTVNSGGPGGSVGLSFYEGYTLGGGAATTGVANFTLTGLPANTGSSSFFGGFRCLFIRVIFNQLVCFSDGAMGYGWKFLDNGTATLNPIGGVLGGTWPFLSCTVSCSAAILQTDLQGMTDVVDEYCPPGYLLATFTFGTTSGSFTSFSMSVEEAVDVTGTITTCDGIPANPDKLTSNAAVVGQPWTATVKLGIGRKNATTWSLFFGTTGVNKPTGINVGQFPPSAPGANFGTNKGGRVLLCNINSPQLCVGIPISTPINSMSSCGGAVPKKLSLVNNGWCGQALIIGGIPSGAGGGGNTRLTSSINGVVGTN